MARGSWYCQLMEAGDCVLPRWNTTSPGRGSSGVSGEEGSGGGYVTRQSSDQPQVHYLSYP